ncbi:MAG: hypothetical protein KC620_04825 [Myxococcales bacterium]|nr:hypothetical protein [Myxococcales bacterium]
MALDKEFIDTLVCPETREKLAIADDELLAKVNAAIRAGKLTNRSGGALASDLGGGLLRADGQVLYPIVDDIPNLLISEAIELDKL